jgi:hypothetical protein
MNFTITKLDRRHAWHDHFPYMIEFRKNAGKIGITKVLVVCWSLIGVGNGSTKPGAGARM